MRPLSMLGKSVQSHSTYMELIIAICALILFSTNSFAEDSLCAQVKLEIKQELTFERQAFEAHMRINNGISHITLENVNIDVSFKDEEGNAILASSDPGNTDALFFIRLGSMDNIANVNGTGTVAPSSAADIRWLIIPAPGAAKENSTGTLYYVGATLSYTIGGEEHVTEVTPDFIVVKPMPELTLDYFLPIDVYGDDAFTSEIEPSIPFSLGVRVSNNGFGAARSLKIKSAQPKITENEQGLLVNFVIEGCEVNGNAVTPTLLADFGDIDPNSAGMARWIMSCSLSGQFIELNAQYSHSNELGGELTSLLEAINTHFLVHDVLVDLPGRDGVRDFFAKDGGVYRVYESDKTDTEVINQSSSSTFQFSANQAQETRYTLIAPITSGFLYVQVQDPFSGEKVLKDVVRSDGKRINGANAWLSKTRDGDNNWLHFVNLFDVNTTNSYTFIFEDLSASPHAPVLQYIPNRQVAEGQQISFIVEASDPNGTIPIISAAPVPAGAGFVNGGNGAGTFDWTPAIGQAGRYAITYTASDGTLKASQSATIMVCTSADSDCDAMNDDWEMENFETLDRDGTGDFDGDGISDMDELTNNTDPTASNAPSVPGIVSPEDGAEVTIIQPDLVIENSIDPDGDVITYQFDVYTEQEMTNMASGQAEVAEGSQNTSWTLPVELEDNKWHYWRVRATDGRGYSEWAYGRFFVNTENDGPGLFFISSPLESSEVDTLTPALEVTNSTDADEDGCYLHLRSLCGQRNEYHCEFCFRG